MVTVFGAVKPSTNDFDPSQPRRFTLDTSTYCPSKSGPIQFSVVCFLENTRRWENVKIPQPGSSLHVVAKLAGRTKDSNSPALRVLNLTVQFGLHAFPTGPHTALKPMGGSTTPSKRPRTMEPQPTPPQSTSTPDLPQSPPACTTPSTIADQDQIAEGSPTPLNNKRRKK